MKIDIQDLHDTALLDIVKADLGYMKHLDNFKLLKNMLLEKYEFNMTQEWELLDFCNTWEEFNEPNMEKPESDFDYIRESWYYNTYLLRN